MTQTTKRIQLSLVGLGLTLSMLIGASTRTHAVTVPALTNPCGGIGGFLTSITDLLPFQLFERGYDCNVNPPQTDSLL